MVLRVQLSLNKDNPLGCHPELQVQMTAMTVSVIDMTVYKRDRLDDQVRIVRIAKTVQRSITSRVHLWRIRTRGIGLYENSSKWVSAWSYINPKKQKADLEK